MEKFIPQTAWEKEIYQRYNLGKRRRTWWTKISKDEWENDFSELNQTQRCLMVSLKIYAGKKDIAFPSHKTLAKNLKVSVLTVLRNIKILEKKGFLEKKKQPGRFNIYTLKKIV
jgi:DNA-binding MarR family transcriptional regulator